MCLKLTFCLLFFCHLGDGADLSTKVTDMTSSLQYSLLNTLFASYDTSVRPVYNVSTKTPISFSLLVRELVNLDEVRQTIVVVLEMWIEWRDEFLVWNDTDYSSIPDIWLTDDSKIWRPYILLRNLKEAERLEYSPTFFSVFSNGTVRTIILWQATASCPTRSYRFPYETVSCNLKFQTWGVSARDVEFTVKEPNLTGDYQGNSEWSLTSTKTEPPKLQASFWNTRYELNFSRRPDFFVANLLIPNFLLIFLCGLQFLLPHEGGDRVSLSITFLLAITVLLLVIADKVPPSSFTVPALSMYFGIGSYMSGFAVLLTIVTTLVHDHNGKSAVPSWCRFLFLNFFARICCVHTRLLDEKSEGDSGLHVDGINLQSAGEGDNEKHKASTSKNKKDWRQLATVIDRIGFIVYYALAFFLTVWFFVVCNTDDSGESIPQ